MQYVKCGFSGENFPTSVFPCVVGMPMLRYEEPLMEQNLKVETMFEKYNFAGVFIQIQVVLTLYAQGDVMADVYFDVASRRWILITG
ncbi:hypothetical protein KY285_030911 [Solanum tuberosum]|nr:hypothetical protein KY285_030911 [Solanum tuberosum]